MRSCGFAPEVVFGIKAVMALASLTCFDLFLSRLQIGSLHENGRGVAKDLSAAELWYRRAASAGNAQAMALLGNLLRRRSYILSADPERVADAAEAEGQATGWWKSAIKADPAVRDSVVELPVLDASLSSSVYARLADGDRAGAVNELMREACGDGSAGAQCQPQALAQLLQAQLQFAQRLEAKAGELQTPFSSAQPDLRSRRVERMRAAVRREGGGAMRECAAFLRATDQYLLFTQLWLGGDRRNALGALYTALFEDEKAVLMASEGPFSQVRRHRSVAEHGERDKSRFLAVGTVRVLIAAWLAG